MEQPDKILSDAIEQMERQLNTCGNSTSCNLPMTTMLALARILRDERDGRCALARLQEQRDQLIGKQQQRLDGEIAERSQRQLEITGRLTALERMVDDPDRMAMSLTKFFRDAARTDDTGPDNARQQSGLGNFVVAKAHEVAEDNGRLRRDIERRAMVITDAVRDRDRAMARCVDLEAQVAALQKAIDDVWALVEEPDGYGSPFWSEPGIDDTTPARAVERILVHLRGLAASRATLADALDRATARISEWRREAERLGHVNAEAMAALNAADRQSDDDQICGC